jgi:thiol-disulfide isomerase/thioredoxin
MAEKTSVVTPERFEQGLSYADYIAQINVNKDQFQSLYDQFQITKEDAEFFSKAVQHPNGPTKMLIIGEDWCPDVYRGMPVMARIAEALGMEIRVFPRDSHLDIMNEFLNKGEYLSIPVAVFYTRDHQYIGHWIERPKAANQERAQIEEQIKRDLPDADDQTARAELRTRNRARFPAWQQASVVEMRQIVAQHLNME